MQVLISVGVTLAAVGFLGLVWYAGAYGPKRRLAQSHGRLVRVHMKTGGSIEGLMLGTWRDSITLRDAYYVEEAGRSRVVGEAVILRENVDWFQDGPVDTSLPTQLEVAEPQRAMVA